MVTGQKPPGQNPPRSIEDIIAKYAVDANLFRLGSTYPKKKSNPWYFFGLLYRELIGGVAFVWVAFVRGLFVSGLLT